MAFEDLFTDPMAAIGYGLLTSRQNPLGTGFDMLTKAQESKRERERQNKLDKLEELKLQQGGDMPSSVREWEYFSSLPEEDKAKYLGMKRAVQTLNLGGEQAVLSPLGGIAESYAVTPKPEQMPEFQAAQESAKKTAGLNAERAGALADRSQKASNVLDLVAEAKKILPNATSGKLDQAGKATANFFGVSTDASKADRQLQVLSAALTSNVPRFEGPQGVMDVELYKQAAGDVANTDIPYPDRLAALQTIKDLQAKYQTQGAETQPMQPAQPTSTRRWKQVQ
jgi:hypothetical protein